MKKIALFAALAVAMCGGVANAASWTYMNNGNTLPSPGWWDGGNMATQQSLVVDQGITCLQVNSWNSYAEWYTASGVGSVLTMGARFKVAASGNGGSEAILQATANTKTSAPIAFGIKQTSTYGPKFCLMNYDNSVVLKEFANFDNNYHTVFIQSAANGAWKAFFDGQSYSGSMTGVDYGGWAEFGSGTYQIKSRETSIYFDWVGYGGADVMVPEPGSFVALGSGLVGLLGLVRRKK